MKPVYTYTIGTQGLAVERLEQIVSKLDALLVDVRTSPKSWNPDYQRANLATLFGQRYAWKGDVLGGFGHTNSRGVEWLKEQRRERTLLLMCMEHRPGDCHRHSDICWPHFPDALHICGDELILARELERSIQDGDEYEVHGSLAELLG